MNSGAGCRMSPGAYPPVGQGPVEAQRNARVARIDPEYMPILTQFLTHCEPGGFPGREPRLFADDFGVGIVSRRLRSGLRASAKHGECYETDFY